MKKLVALLGRRNETDELLLEVKTAVCQIVELVESIRVLGLENHGAGRMQPERDEAAVKRLYAGHSSDGVYIAPTGASAAEISEGLAKFAPSVFSYLVADSADGDEVVAHPGSVGDQASRD